MIYEFRTYRLRPGSLPEVLKRFGEAYPHRSRYSALAACWYTEIGPLNQIVHVWPYADLGERARIRAEAAQDAHWPPALHEFLLETRSEIYLPFPFSPAIEPGRPGPVFEMRTYDVAPGGGLQRTIERWGPMLPGRTARSPLLFAGYAELGALSRYVHIWPYASLDERARIRRESTAAGLWPPPGVLQDYTRMENKILLPAPFSPVQ